MNTDIMLLQCSTNSAYRAPDEYQGEAMQWYTNESVWNCEPPRGKSPLRRALKRLSRLSLRRGAAPSPARAR